MARTSPIIIAGRYAHALLSAVGTDEAADRTDLELRALAEVLGPIRRRLPLGSAKASAVLAARIAGAAALSAPVRRLLGVLSRRCRLALLPQLALAFTKALNAARKRVEAEVTTVSPLSEEQRRRLALLLTDLTGCREVAVRERTDEALRAGFRVRCAGFVLDASLQRRLERAETAMKGTF